MPLSRLLRPAVAVLCVGLATALGLAATSPSGRAQSATDFARPEVAWAAPTAGRIAADANLTTALGLPECADGSVLSFDRVRFGGRGWGCVDRVTNATTATGAAVADSLNPTGLPTCGDGEVLKSTGSGFACVSAARQTAQGVTCNNGQVITSDGQVLSCFDAVAADRDPDPFAFTSQTNVNTGIVVSSNSVVMNGFDPPLQITATGEGNPQISLDGGTTWRTSGEITSVGQILMVRMTTPEAYSASRTVTVTAGIRAGQWSVTTRPETFGTFTFVNPCGGQAQGCGYCPTPNTFTGGCECPSGSTMYVTSSSCGGQSTYCERWYTWSAECRG